MEVTRANDRVRTTNPCERRRDRARGRWKLLQQAIVKQTMNPLDSPCSIHNFPGFGLLSAPMILSLGDSSNAILDSLTCIHCPDRNHGIWTLEILHEELKVFFFAMGALELNEPTVVMDLSLSPPLPSDLTENKITKLLVVEQDYGIERCQLIGNECIRVTFGACPSSLSSCSVRKYSVDAATFVLTRERANRKIHLRELASHQHHGVDNTGNVCVWDAEKTLTWALLQEKNVGVKIITELGVGMAGLAALALAAKGVAQSQVNLTDGHADCVLNNRVNVKLMTAFGMLQAQSPPRVQCCRLLWTCLSSRQDEPDLFPSPSDWTLVSDCTHFEEHHGNLFWTLVECTKVNGFIWMCQPRRGLSLHRFLQLVEDVNVHSASPLISVQERVYSEIEQKHNSFLATEVASYNPDIHKPLIYVLTKLRDATEEDRLWVIRCMETRG